MCNFSRRILPDLDLDLLETIKLEKELQIDIPSVSPPPAPPTLPPLSPPTPQPEMSVETILQLLYPEVCVFACPDCGKVFAKKSLLTKHHREEHVRYPCNKCNYQAKQRSGLKIHMEGKHNVNRLRCGDYCNFQTKWRKSLIRHQKLCMARARLDGEWDKDSKMTPPYHSCTENFVVQHIQFLVLSSIYYYCCIVFKSFVLSSGSGSSIIWNCGEI